MLTRCPACQTVFRVAPEQLAARAGRVRCGHCLNAFNAAQNAVTKTAPAETSEEQEPAPVPPAQPARSPEAAPKFELSFEVAPDETSAEWPAVLHTPSRPPEGLQPTLPEDEWQAAEAPPVEIEEEPAGVEPSHAAPLPGAPEDETVAESHEGDRPLLIHSASADDEERAPAIALPPTLILATPETPDRRRAWGIALGGLTMTLLVQGLFLLRQPLTQAIPALRPPLVALCQHLGCELHLPREAGDISIEASDLHPEPGGRGDFVLHATLKNRAAYPQAYPHVELSLTDAADKALVRRVFSPAEWAPDRPAEAAFGPGTTAIVALPFNAAGVAAVGYRVYAFYP
jgi:predicted Zn finger-like uncharacterized protein